MRVLFVSAAAHLGGAERSLLELIRALIARGVQCGAAVPAEGALSRALVAAGAAVYSVPMRSIRRTVDPRVLGGYLMALGRSTRQLIEIIREDGYRIVHGNSDVGQLYGAHADQRGQVKSVWHGRDLTRLGPIAGHLVQRTDCVIAISPAVARHLSSLGVPSDKLRLIPNGIDLEPFATGDERARRRRAARQELGVEEGTLVGTAAAFVPWKRVEDFVTVYGLFSRRAMAPSGEDRARGAADASGFALVRRVAGRAVIFGDDVLGLHEAYAKGLKRQAQEAAGERIIFCGWRDDLAQLLPALDAFVSTSRDEPFGRVLVEAMAAGVPVLTNDSGGKGYIIEDGRTGRVLPDRDLHGLADALFDLVTRPQAAAELAANARRAALARFDISRTADKVLEVYEELLEK